MLKLRWPSRVGLASGVLCTLGSLGCDAEPTNIYTGGAGNKKPVDSGMPSPVGEAGATNGDGGGGPCILEPVTCAGEPVADACNTPADTSLGSISGTVSIANGVAPGGGMPAVGDLYLFVVPSFSITTCPGDPLGEVAKAVVHCADMREGAAVPFTIEGVPLREQAWQVVTYLDVNMKEPGAVALDSCDVLVSPPAVMVNSAQAAKLDIQLNLSGSIIAAGCSLPACE